MEENEDEKVVASNQGLPAGGLLCGSCGKKLKKAAETADSYFSDFWSLPRADCGSRFANWKRFKGGRKRRRIERQLAHLSDTFATSQNDQV